MNIASVRRCCVVATLSLSFVVGWDAHGNVGYFGGGGSSLLPMSSQDIAMKSERVRLHLASSDRLQVRARFVLENTTDKARRITVGFPFVASPDLAAQPAGTARRKKGQALVWRFRATVRGRLVRWKASRLKGNKNDVLAWDNYIIYAWSFQIGAREQVIVTASYLTGLSDSGDGAMNYVDYVLRTGAMWKGGQIGRSLIEFSSTVGFETCDHFEGLWRVGSHGGMIAPTPDKPVPAGYRRVGRGPKATLVWDLRNFRPRKDLRVCLRTTATTKNLLKEAAIDDLASVGIEKIRDVGELRRLRNTIPALYGYVFKSPALRTYFDRTFWYHTDPSFKLRQLPRWAARSMKQIRQQELRLQEELPLDRGAAGRGCEAS